MDACLKKIKIKGGGGGEEVFKIVIIAECTVLL
jgi:hypothetical protein